MDPSFAHMLTPAVRQLMAALEPADTRVVGGAVRTALLSHASANTDIDLATTATPTQVLERLQSADIKAIPTGLAHGTITAIIAKKPFEITTLRQDITTDGRNATVAFTDDFMLDSSRRDFTINALYVDADGALFDPHDGVTDLKNGIVRFIGDPLQRIEEDHLRILRFCRFSAAHAKQLDGASWNACVTKQSTLTQLAPERITAELTKLLTLPRAAWMLEHMQKTGILETLQLSFIQPAYLHKAQPSPLQRWYLLSNDQVETLLNNPFLAWSNTQKNALKQLAQAEQYWQQGVQNPHKLAYLSGLEAAQFTLQQHGEKAAAVRLTQADIPIFPLRGEDVLAQGIPAGPQIGAILQKIETWWLAADFPNREACLSQLQLRVNPKT